MPRVVALMLILLPLAICAPPAAAQALNSHSADLTITAPDDHGSDSQPPRISEEQAEGIARGATGVAAILKQHPELQMHDAFDSDSRIWTIYWTLTGNYRRLISVDIADGSGGIVNTVITNEARHGIIPTLSESDAIALARSQPKVIDEIGGKHVTNNADLGRDQVWTVGFYQGSSEIAEVLVNDESGTVNEVRTGPQVAWQMARGYPGAFGRIINEPYIWLPLCALFLAPFVDWRRPWRLLNLDLLVLLSFTVSHYYFNQGEIQISVPLSYPPLAYLFLRLIWMAVKRRRARRAAPPPGAPAPGFATPPLLPASREEFSHHLAAASRWTPPRPQEAITPAPEEDDSGAAMPRLNFPPWLLLVGLVALLIFRVTINIADSNVVDVGYSGVIGAQRILSGKTPYGNMPSDDANGDTYGPMNYLLYVPFERAFGWSGHWDDLPAAHAAALFFDLAAVAGMYLVGRRLMRTRPRKRHAMGLALAYGWAAFPYTAFVLNCNVNDSIVASILIWGFLLLPRLPLAGIALGFASGVKFFPALLAPLWASFPRAFRGWRRRILFVLGFALALLVTLPVILMGGGSLHTFWQRTLQWQLQRSSPFSIWGMYPDRLATAQHVGQYLLITLAVFLYFWPPKKNLVQAAAASAALLVGFQLLLTHWFYLYIPWFFPLALVAFLTRPGRKERKRREFETRARPDAGALSGTA